MKRRPAIYFTTASAAPPPRELSTHAISRFIERWNERLGLLDAACAATPVGLFDADGLDRALWAHATAMLGGSLGSAQLISWEPRDLDGLGQGIWGIPISVAGDESGFVRIAVDGNGLVRTVLPPS